VGSGLGSSLVVPVGLALLVALASVLGPLVGVLLAEEAGALGIDVAALGGLEAVLGSTPGVVVIGSVPVAASSPHPEGSTRAAQSQIRNWCLMGYRDERQRRFSSPETRGGGHSLGGRIPRRPHPARGLAWESSVVGSFRPHEQTPTTS
jgi:hypothetical protein